MIADPILDVVSSRWGYESLRPLQREAMDAAVAGRDSLVVLPTGGGKSLCYSAPALLADGLTVVVSPLISLMKDQVDKLLAKNIPAAFLNSSLDSDDRRRVTASVSHGECKLLFVSPERFAGDYFTRSLKQWKVRAFAIDEAHCISHWGHDFRADYRELGMLKREFPDAAVHAFTATATPRVRKDIVKELGLRDAAVLVGDFFRPNLTYRSIRRGAQFEDAIAEVRSRQGLPGIVYCIRRDDVDTLSKRLRDLGVKAAPYHAGMSDDARTRAQDRFAGGETDVIVATVAFGMGIDRADIRYVIHAAMPKSVEHYQQETGRAGRDGKPADCILLYSGADFMLWKTILQNNDSGQLDDQMKMLSEMYDFCTQIRCRHKKLVEYFGQAWTREACGSCDVCTGTMKSMEGSSTTARTILAGVSDTGQRYGIGYISDVLLGAVTEQVEARGGQKSAGFAKLSGHSKGAIFSWINQLVDQGMLRREGEYGVLKITTTGQNVMRSEAEANLFDVAGTRKKKSKSKKKVVEVREEDPVEDGTSRELFEKLKSLRRSIAEGRDMPAFMVFSDKTLRAMAKARPVSEESMLQVFGVGPAKMEEYGEKFLRAIRDHGK